MRKSDAKVKLCAFINTRDEMESRKMICQIGLAEKILDFCVNELGMMPPECEVWKKIKNESLKDKEILVRKPQWEPED